MIKPDLKLGKIAFIAYCRSKKGLTHDNKPIPKWEDVGEAIQGAWGVAARTSLVCGMSEVARHQCELLEEYYAAHECEETLEAETLSHISADTGSDESPTKLPSPYWEQLPTDLQEAWERNDERTVFAIIETEYDRWKKSTQF